ncbi:hypothetical protein XH96_04780 [Bradyrhizobium sp. CCBAU 51765]|nr:hypothetical protein XH96_04780 [Bradyrhizobium sp. CCBAU 51765]
MHEGDEQAFRIKGNEIGDLAGTIIAEQPPVARGPIIRRYQIRCVVAHIAKKGVVFADLIRHVDLFLALARSGFLISQLIGLAVGSRRK